MSNKRKARPRKATRYIDSLPLTETTKGEGKAFQTRVIDAPMLKPPIIKSTDEQGLILEVDKVGFLGGAESTVLFGQGVTYIETTDAEIYRLPPELGMWATGVVSTVLAAGGRDSGIFPTRIEFGILDGRVYAEMVD